MNNRDKAFILNLINECSGGDANVFKRAAAVRLKINNDETLDDLDIVFYINRLGAYNFSLGNLRFKEGITLPCINMEGAVVGGNFHSYCLTVIGDNNQVGMKVGGHNYQGAMKVGGHNYQGAMKVGGHNYQGAMKVGGDNNQGDMKVGGYNVQGGMNIGGDNDQGDMKVGGTNYLT